VQEQHQRQAKNIKLKPSIMLVAPHCPNGLTSINEDLTVTRSGSTGIVGLKLE